MAILYTYITRVEAKRLSERDHSYFKQKLEERGWFNQLMQRPVNRPLLNELLCLLDKKPIPRRGTGRLVREQFPRISDGVRRPVKVTKVSPEEMEELWK